MKVHGALPIVKGNPRGLNKGATLHKQISTIIIIIIIITITFNIEVESVVLVVMATPTSATQQIQPGGKYRLARHSRFDIAYS